MIGAYAVDPKKPVDSKAGPTCVAGARMAGVAVARNIRVWRGAGCRSGGHLNQKGEWVTTQGEETFDEIVTVERVRKVRVWCGHVMHAGPSLIDVGLVT